MIDGELDCSEEGCEEEEGSWLDTLRLLVRCDSSDGVGGRVEEVEVEEIDDRSFREVLDDLGVCLLLKEIVVSGMDVDPKVTRSEEEKKRS